MKTDTRKITQLILLLLLSISIGLWAFNLVFNFLPSNTDLVMIISAMLSFIGAIASAPENIQKWIGFFSPQTAETEHKTTLLRELREREGTLTPKQAHAYTENILGAATGAAFWQEIASNEKQAKLLARLSADPFWLEGLIIVFESNAQRLPRNPGALCDKLLEAQWTKQKLGKNSWVGLKAARLAFSRLADRNFPASQYPDERFDGSHFSWKAYAEVLDFLGATRNFIPPKWLFNLSIAADRAIGVDWESVSARLGKLPAWRRNIETFFLMRVWGIVDFFANAPQRLIDWLGFRRRRALALLTLAERAHLIERKEQSFSFPLSAWQVYFAAHAAAKDDFDSLIGRTGAHWRTNCWNRIRPAEDRMVIAVCGLLPNAIPLIEKLVVSDPFLAAQCITSGVDNVPEPLREQAHDDLLASILNVRTENEIISLDAAGVLRELKDDPSVVERILDALDANRVDVVRARLARMVAGYGRKAFDVLTRRLETGGYYSRRIAILALGYLGDARVTLLLRGLLEHADADLRMTALMVLATSLHDPYVTEEWEHTLRFHRGKRYEDSKLLWSYVDDAVGAEVFPLLLQVFEKAAAEPQEVRNRNAFRGGLWGDAGDWFIWVLNHRYQQDAQVEAMLLNRLQRATDPALQRLLVQGLNAVQGANSVDALLESLASPDIDVQCAAIAALARIKSPRSVYDLIGKMYARDQFVVMEAINALGELGAEAAVPRLVEKLGSADVARHEDIPNHFGYPIDFLAMQALVQIGTREALEQAYAWCQAHQADTRKFNWGHQGESVAERCAEHAERIRSRLLYKFDLNV